MDLGTICRDPNTEEFSGMALSSGGWIKCSFERQLNQLSIGSPVPYAVANDKHEPGGDWHLLHQCCGSVCESSPP
jgi:hypothetical protein